MGSRVTKIEVVIIIFLILLAIGGDIFANWYLNKKARDITILSEINQIRSALEVFLSANNYYPKTTDFVALNDAYLGTQKLCLEGFKRESDICSKNILDPLPNFYTKQGNAYAYKSVENGQNYEIQFTLNTNFPQFGLKKGINCATNLTIISQPCL
jgi:hypothetical protein